MSTTVTDRSTTSTAATPSAAPRFDIYKPIHRALRLFMCDTLVRVGSLDPLDPGELATTLDQVRSLLAMCRNHLEKENRYVHPAIEARRPGTSTRIAEEHESHVEAIALLDADAAMLLAAPGAAAAERLYKHLALFVAENFTHMHEEETSHNAALWETCSDEEILGIERAIIASTPIPDGVALMRWMVPALAPIDRPGLLAGLRQQLPPEGFAAVLDVVRPHLSDKAWAKLARALELPARPWTA